MGGSHELFPLSCLFIFSLKHTLFLIVILCFLCITDRNVFANQSLISELAQGLHHEVMKESLWRSLSVWYHWFRVGCFNPLRQDGARVGSKNTQHTRQTWPCIYEQVLHTPTSFQWQPALQSPHNDNEDVGIHHCNMSFNMPVTEPTYYMAPRLPDVCWGDKTLGWGVSNTI